MMDIDEIYRRAAGGTFNVDLGNQGDYTAYSVTFLVEQRDSDTVDGIPRKVHEIRNFYYIDQLERVPLGMSYPEIVKDVKNRLQDSRLRNFRLVVDATGVGLPVLQMMSDEGLDPLGICITGGNNPGEWKDPKGRRMGYTVPKRDIITVMQSIFTGRRIKIFPSEGARTLVDELANYKYKLSRNGSDTYEAWRESIHDDLVMSSGIGLWYLNHIYGTKRKVIDENLELFKDKYDKFDVFGHI